jgi:hypothetical protein
MKEDTSETSVEFYQTTRRNIPEDSHLQFEVCVYEHYIMTITGHNLN